MPIPTLDPDVVIDLRNEAAQVTHYRRVSTGELWEVHGACNQCGLCVIGAIGEWYVWDGPAGTPFSSRDTRVPDRPDDPITVGFVEKMARMAAQTPTATVTGCALSIVPVR